MHLWEISAMATDTRQGQIKVINLTTWLPMKECNLIHNRNKPASPDLRLEGRKGIWTVNNNITGIQKQLLVKIPISQKWQVSSSFKFSVRFCSQIPPQGIKLDELFSLWKYNN